MEVELSVGPEKRVLTFVSVSCRYRKSSRRDTRVHARVGIEETRESIGTVGLKKRCGRCRKRTI